MPNETVIILQNTLLRQQKASSSYMVRMIVIAAKADLKPESLPAVPGMQYDRWKHRPGWRDMGLGLAWISHEHCVDFDKMNVISMF
jgi:hypothetical protein